MRAITVGKDAEGRNIVLTEKMRQSTHTHVVGGSGKGKSKFLESLIRKDIRAGNGLCLIDWHGTLYDDVLRYCSYLDVGLKRDFRKLILINPSEPNYITGFNPFVNQGADISVQVRRRIEATIRPWGITDTNAMPTFENVMYALYSFAAEMKETLPNAACLLEYDRPELRRWAAEVVTEREGKRQLQRLVQTKTFREWRDFVLSTENRLGRFLGSKSVRRFMGMKEGNLDLMKAMNEGAIVLVNLGSSDYLDRESARVFASLFLNEFFETAMRRAKLDNDGKKPETFCLYLDEFQEYITDDIGSMLDQVRKGGLHMILAHQHFGHLIDNKRLLKSILANARIRAVFGGLDYEDACLLATEMFLTDLNTRQIKKAYYHTIHLYEEQQRLTRSYTEGGGESVSENWNESSGRSVSEGESFGKGSGTGYSTGHSQTRGISHTTGDSLAFGNTISSGVNFGAIGNEFGTVNTEGWFSESEGMAQSNSETHAESMTDSEAETNSESYSEFESESYALSKAETFSKTLGRGSGVSISKSSSEGVSIVPVWVPIPTMELGSETEWSREEKLSKVAEMLKTQQERHCFIKIDTVKTQPLLVPFVKDYSVSKESLLEYEKEVYTVQAALSSQDVDVILRENEIEFLALASGKAINDNITVENSAALIASKREPKNITPAGKKRTKTVFDDLKKNNPDLDLDG